MKHILKKMQLGIVTFSMLASVQSFAMTCYVEENGVGGGSSWADTSDLQGALGDASCDIIWVKQGTYYPTNDSNREISFVIDRPLALYGGFSGTETSLGERDVVNNLTILSGNIGSASINTDNSYHVILVDNSLIDITDTTLIDGFDVVDGYSTEYYGGGLNCVERYDFMCAPTLRHMNFINNHARIGGAINGYTGNLDEETDIQFVNFENNYAEIWGGAIELIMSGGNYGVYFKDVTFNQNSSDSGGGAINAFFSRLASGATSNLISVEQTEFIGNTSDTAGAIDSQSAGDGTTVKWSFNEVKFIDNMADPGSGGAIRNYAKQDSTINMAFNDTEFIGNQSGFDGGAIHSFDSTNGITHLTINNSAFINNQAGRDAGAFNHAVRGLTNSLEITNSTFSGNSAGNEGGAIWHGSTNVGPDIKLNHVTFYQNTAADSGGALYNYGTANTTTPTEINNTIMWGNSAPSGSQLHNSDASASAEIDSSIVDGGCPVDSICTDLSDEDPLLGSLGYHHGLTQSFPLLSNSPALDTANPANCLDTDQRGVPRPFDGDFDGTSDCDIGAYEFIIDLIFVDGFE